MKTIPIVPIEIGSAVSVEECEKLAELAEGKVCLELGSFLGRSSIVIAQVASELHCVDWHRGETPGLKDVGVSDSLVTWWNNVRQYGLLDRIVMHVGTTEMVLPHLRGLFGFAFIDADHSYHAVKQDIEGSRPLMWPGAPMMFHDYTWEELGVQRAVEEAFADVELCETSAIVYA